jgi:membrane protease YdiL (CAAX protease family)
MAMSDGPASARSGRLAAWLTVIAVLTFLNYYGRAVAGTPERDVLYEWSTFAGALVQFGLMLVIVLLIARRGPARELLALRRPTGWGRAALIALGVYIGTLIVAGALAPFLNAEEEQGLVPEAWDPDRAAPFLANFAVVTLFVPVVEELTFRGVGFTLLAARLGRVLTVVVVGVLFGLAHGLLAGLPVLIAFGLGLAWLRSRTQSVYPCMILHGFFNAVALLVAVTFGEG